MFHVTKKEGTTIATVLTGHGKSVLITGGANITPSINKLSWNN